MTWAATRLSMIVERISLTPKYALSAPGIAPHTAPPRRPAKITTGTSMNPEVSGSSKIAPVEKMAPEIIWPSPPMLMTLARKAIVMPTPTRSNGVAFRAVSMRALVEPKAPSSIAQ